MIKHRNVLEGSELAYGHSSFGLVMRDYTNIPCDQYTRIFSRGTLNCMDVLYCLTPTAECSITHPCNSRYRGKMFLYIDHSHIKYLLYYILIVK
jgi:hypothetical protein